MTNPSVWDVVRLINLAACLTIIAMLAVRWRWVRAQLPNVRLFLYGVGGLAFALGQASLLLVLPARYSPEGLRVLTLTVSLTWVVMALVRTRGVSSGTVSPALPAPPLPAPPLPAPEPPVPSHLGPVRLAPLSTPPQWAHIVHGAPPGADDPVALPPAPVSPRRRGRHADPPAEAP